jgi:hypothetical protein
MSCFSFYLFSSAKLENRWVEQVLPRGEGWHVLEGGGRERNEYGTKNAYTCM